jgi:hypothetical protein
MSRTIVPRITVLIPPRPRKGGEQEKRHRNEKDRTADAARVDVAAAGEQEQTAADLQRSDQGE